MVAVAMKWQKLCILHFCIAEVYRVVISERSPAADNFFHFIGI